MTPFWIVTSLLAALLVIGIILWFKVMRPLRAIDRGVELLQSNDFSSRLAHVGQREADRIVDMFNGMMNTLKQERLRLREQNHLLDLLIDVSPMGIIILDSDGAIASANPAAVQYLDRTSPAQLTGKLPDATGSRLGRLIASLKPGEAAVVRLNTAMVYKCARNTFFESGVPHQFITIEKLTDEVMRAERSAFEKVIRLMAHEVNNSMAGVTSVLSMASAETDDAEMAEVLDACQSRCRGMSSFISKFAEAVKIPEPVKTDTDLNELAGRLTPMLETLCAQNGATLHTRLPKSVVNAFVDPVLIEQVITNIVKNAAESCANGGEVTLEVSACPAGLIVTDNGPGIDEATSSQLFTPFFTTKPSGHGLGLLMVSDVLHRHGARFSLATDDDGLTRFRISF